MLLGCPIRTRFYLVVGIILSLQIYASPIQLVPVGDGPNQLFSTPYGLVSINSGFNGKASISVLHDGAVDTYEIKQNSNPYRGIIEGSKLFVTLNATDELLEIDLNSLNPQSHTLKSKILYQAPIEITGAESIAKLGENKILSFSNVLPDLSFLPATLLLFKPDISFPIKVDLELKNVNNLLGINDSELSFASGVYGQNQGAIGVFKIKEMLGYSNKYHWTQKELVEKHLLDLVKVGGTPGPLLIDGTVLWSCDLETPKIYKVDLVSRHFKVFDSTFKACSAMLKIGSVFYLSDLYGDGHTRAHLHAFNENNFKNPICSLNLTQSPSNRLAFISDIKQLNRTKLTLSLGGHNSIALVKLDERSLPLDCR